MGRRLNKFINRLGPLFNSGSDAVEYDEEKGIYNHINPFKRYLIPSIVVLALASGAAHSFFRTKSPGEFEAEQKRKEKTEVVSLTSTSPSKNQLSLDWSNYLPVPKDPNGFTDSEKVKLEQALIHSSTYLQNHAKQSIQETPNFQTAQSIAPEVKAIFTGSTKISKSIKKVSTETKRVIYQSDLENAGTVFEGTHTLRYTSRGINVPDSSYAVVVDGKKTLPDCSLSIALSPDFLENSHKHKIRLAKMDEDGNYIASISVRIDKPDFEIDPLYQTVRKDPVRNFHDVIDVRTQTTKRFASSKKEDLEKKVTPAINPVSTKSCLDSVVETSSQSSYTFLTSDSISQAMALYASVRTNRKELSDTVAKGLNQGYQFENVDSSRLNKDGYMRSDSNVVKKLMYGENRSETFSQRAVELKSQGLSNKKIAKIMREEANINVNEKQVSDSLASEGWISRESYNNNPHKYNTPNTTLIIYHGNGRVTISPANK
ncbi:MAG: hypothetical protein AABW63_01140 [Nanoarchaeota archaeon]